MAKYIDVERYSFPTLHQKEVNDYMKGWNTCLKSVLQQPTAYVVEVKKIEIVRDDLKWWLETNSEKGVVHIPKYIVETMIAKLDGGKEE